MALHHHDNGSMSPLLRCEHVDVEDVSEVWPPSTVCVECRLRGNGWVQLCQCLSCGWTACSDDSPNQHAKAHYEETNHPVTVSLAPGLIRRWCYVHERTV
jgi:uncharacterized UBP type Zn finger protein